MPPSIRTSHHGATLTIELGGPLDHRLASGLFSRLLAADSRAKEVILDLSAIDCVRDSGIAALRLLRHRAHQAGKHLTVVHHRPTADHPAPAALGTY